MATLEDGLFTLQLLIYVGIFLVKIWNIMNLGDKFDFDKIILLYVGAVLSYGIGFVTTLINYDDLLMSAIFKLQGWMFPFITLFLFIQIIIKLHNATDTRIKAYKPEKRSFR